MRFWSPAVSTEGHKTHLLPLSKRLMEHFVTTNPVKCPLNKTGARVPKKSHFGLQHRGLSIKDSPGPSGFRQLRLFYGLINCYRRSTPRCASLLQPSTKRLRVRSGLSNSQLRHAKPSTSSRKIYPTPKAQSILSGPSLLPADILAN